MGIVQNQSFKNTIITYLGFGIGAINILFLYTKFLPDDYHGLLGEISLIQKDTREEEYRSICNILKDSQHSSILVIFKRNLWNNRGHPFWRILEEFDIDVQQNTLTMTAKVASTMDHLQSIYQEYGIGGYQRSFTLGEQIDVDKISAKLRDGVLALTLPKKEKHRPHKIKIQT